MLECSTGQSAEESLRDGNPQYGPGGTDGALATLKATEDNVEGDFLVWDASSTERFDELAEEPRHSKLYNAYGVSVLHRLVSRDE